jgi:hypothetical protein
MPNGKIGDHPLTDILVHNRSVFSLEIDGLIRKIAAIEGTQELSKRFNWFSLPPRKELKRELRKILAELEKQEES